jgi:Lar family restriction alleviation protein
MMEKLRTCPFCGGEAEVREAKYLGLKGFVVTCLKCGIETRLMEDKNQSVWLWNRRDDDGHKGED